MFDDRLVIPQNMQLDILNKLHAGHLGMTKCKGRAYSSMWWPSITSQIEAMCRKCLTCLLHQDEKAEPLLALSPPTEIWERIGTDLFEFKKEHYVCHRGLRLQMARFQKVKLHKQSSGHKSTE